MDVSAYQNSVQVEKFMESAPAISLSVMHGRRVRRDGQGGNKKFKLGCQTCDQTLDSALARKSGKWISLGLLHW
jgi:hypothetical protein